MMRPRTFVTALVSVFLASSLAAAQDSPTDVEFEMTKYGQAGMKFLEVGLSARAEGMGGAVTAIPMGAASMFYNPAGLASSIGERGDLFVSQTGWIADVTVLAGAVSYVTPYAVVGVSFMGVDYGTIKGTAMRDRFTMEPEWDLEPASMAIGIGLAKRVTDKFQIGLTSRLVTEDLGGTDVAGYDDTGASISTLVWDAGTLYRTGWGSSVLSMSIRNFSMKVKHQDEEYELPLIFRFGVAMDVLNLSGTADSKQALNVSIDALHPRDRAEEAILGLEYGFMDMLYVRAGSRLGNDYTGADIDKPLTVSIASLGGGVRYKIGPADLNVNYAWSNQGDLLGSVQRFDVQVGF